MELGSEYVQARIKPEEVARLWMNENTVVNSKANYFTAVNGALFVSLAQVKEPRLASLVATVGLCVAVLAFLSISRTCAYRRHFRTLLEHNDGYREAFTFRLAGSERLRSNLVLVFVPAAGALAWAILLALIFYTGAPPQAWK